jgi:hypothetical protein
VIKIKLGKQKRADVVRERKALKDLRIGNGSKYFTSVASWI